MNSRQRRRQEAEQHNQARAERLAFEKDKRENPEKYRRKRRVRSGSSVMPFIATAMTISPSAFDDRLARR